MGILHRNPRNLLIDSVNASVKRDLLPSAEKDCYERFIVFRVLNYIMHAEWFTLCDMLEEHGMMRHKIKQHTKKCMDEYKKYQDIVKSSFTEEARYLEYDLLIDAHHRVEKQISTMRACFLAFLNKGDYKYADLLAQAAVPLEVAGLINYLWPMFFAKYRRVCGVDFSPCYKYADMTTFIKYLNDIARELMERNTILDFSKDDNCAKSQREFEQAVIAEDTLNDAAHTALSYLRENRINKSSDNKTNE